MKAIKRAILEIHREPEPQPASIRLGGRDQFSFARWIRIEEENRKQIEKNSRKVHPPSRPTTFEFGLKPVCGRLIRKSLRVLHSSPQACSSMPAPIFVSYSSRDRAVANRLVDFLKEQGYDCWIDWRDEEPGADYREPIMAALTAAKIILLILSEASNDSPDVHSEIVQATRQKKLIIPVEIEPVSPNQRLEFSIRSVHWLDGKNGLSSTTLNQLKLVVDRHLRGFLEAKSEGELDELTSKAARGDVTSQAALAEHFGHAGKDPLNREKAVYWLRKAAENAHAESAYRLATALRDGIGILRNEDAALNWFRAAAEGGHVKAQAIFANELLLGRRLSADPEKALYWFERAAQQGSVEAQFQVGVLFENGRAGAHDYSRSIYWLDAAANNGHAGAQYLLATLLAEGKGGMADMARAKHWAQAASDRGHLAARQFLTQLCSPDKSPGKR
jgi:hypothetical protein